MTTVRDIVGSALARLRVSGLGDTPAAEEAQRGLDRLNDMLAAWKASNVDLMVSDFGLSDTFVFFVPPASWTSANIDARTDKGDWNASTNSPSLASATGTEGDFYKVSTAGSTTLDDVTSWAADDYAAYNGTAWLKGQSSRKHEKAIIALLAIDCCDDFGKQPTPMLMRDARSGWYGIQADYIKAPPAVYDMALVRTFGRRYYVSSSS